MKKEIKSEVYFKSFYIIKSLLTNSIIIQKDYKIIYSKLFFQDLEIMSDQMQYSWYQKSFKNFSFINKQSIIQSLI